MNVIKDDVIKLVAKELASANERFPLFHSEHEGYGVIIEESTECHQEMKRIIESNDDLLRFIIKNSSYSAKEDIIKYMYEIAINLACEAIQVAAMCDKWEMSFGKDREE